ncbi:MAG: RlmE family RNA methyltransferase [Sphingomonadaceae bacterium]|uniref:RlmE family RNA methyltransferase n=1 Tax=Thermaurantiacus sp. TaxID=2820283 RepID=UPI00298F0ADA|nr:RlmE family RNA methyltransferase [Thermaurantiacus sp.]MCS6987509.1 RlmE family RNA methyltransferase [Sphingomonadaceae bacterium]MDW8415110.1 RlmE family RNA methyltransferase [Thermaurantiacus sp.]
MSRGADGGRRPVRARSASSARWIRRQLADPYVRRAQAEGWRSRAAFKLMELDDRFGLLRGVRGVLDLGAAPGSWSQVVRARAPAARVVAVDRLEMAPIEEVEVLRLDLLETDAAEAVAAALRGPVDLVLSDMAANTVGHARTDHLRTMALVEAAAGLAVEVLAPGGAFVAKLLAGGTEPELLAELKRRFADVRHAKPPASRKESRETYVVARGFRPVT